MNTVQAQSITNARDRLRQAEKLARELADLARQIMEDAQIDARDAMKNGEWDDAGEFQSLANDAQRLWCKLP